MEYFVPYTPHPLDGHYQFEDDPALNRQIEQILEACGDELTVIEAWHRYFSHNLRMPFEIVFLTPAIESDSGGLRAHRLKAKVVRLAPPDHCPARDLVLTVHVRMTDHSHHVFTRDIREVMDQSMEEIIVLLRYWQDHYVSRENKKQ